MLTVRSARSVDVRSVSGFSRTSTGPPHTKGGHDGKLWADRATVVKNGGPDEPAAYFVSSSASARQGPVFEMIKRTGTEMTMSAPPHR